MNQLILLVFTIMLACTTIDTAPLMAKRDQYKGSATFYSPGLGSCGITNSPQDLIVALNVPQYTGNVCNKVVLITGPKGSVKCTITDKCPGCGFGCLDLSPAAFDQIGDESAGVVPITWSFVDDSDNPPPATTQSQPTTSASSTTSTTTSDSASSTSSTSETSSSTSTTDETPTQTSTPSVIKLTDVMNNFYNGTVVNYDSDTESYPSMALPSSSDTSSSTSTTTSTPSPS